MDFWSTTATIVARLMDFHTRVLYGAPSQVLRWVQMQDTLEHARHFPAPICPQI